VAERMTSASCGLRGSVEKTRQARIKRAFFLSFHPRFEWAVEELHKLVELFRLIPDKAYVDFRAHLCILFRPG
jgi:hypothetical protein